MGTTTKDAPAWAGSAAATMATGCSPNNGGLQSTWSEHDLQKSVISEEVQLLENGHVAQTLLCFRWVEFDASEASDGLEWTLKRESERRSSQCGRKCTVLDADLVWVIGRDAHRDEKLEYSKCRAEMLLFTLIKQRVWYLHTLPCLSQHRE